jgi:hypothetical protein
MLRHKWHSHRRMDGDTAKLSETYADEELVQAHMAKLLGADARSMRGCKP